MATGYGVFDPESAQFLSSVFPQYVRTLGTAFPVVGLAFDAAADEAAFWRLPVPNYGSGNLTLEINWYADTASSGDVVWDAAIAAITPGVGAGTGDTQDVETKALASVVSGTDSHLGTTGQRVHKASIAINQLDSVAAGDLVWIRIRRVGSDGSDTMLGDAILIQGVLSFTTA